MKKELSAEEARLKAEAYCSLSEHCKSEVLGKLQQWGAPEKTWEAILNHLEKERYVDESRYATFFVRDKYRFNQWGRIKIAQALRMKHIPSACIDEAMEEIDEQEYLNILTSLLKKKVRSIKASNDYERNGKLVRYAAGHGYEIGDILLCMKRMGYDDEYME
jgi:regulatory protein